MGTWLALYLIAASFCLEDTIPRPAYPGLVLSAVTVLGDAEHSLRLIPGSGVRISGLLLERLQPRSIEEVLRTVPGLYVRPEEGFGLRPNIGVRGLPLRAAPRCCCWKTVCLSLWPRMGIPPPTTILLWSASAP